jgi:signal transduction histidine kinase
VILVYSLTAQEELEPQIQMSIGRVRAWADANPAHADADIVLGLVAHARTLLSRKPKVDALTSRLVSLPTGTEADAMLRTYQEEFSRALQVTQTYRLALFLCCVALLGGIAWAPRALRQSNLHLEHRVRDRTSELSGKNTELQTEIADRKKAEEERQRMEIQLRHAQKMESIGQLAAGIAHEINTPTQFIGDNTRFIRDSFGALQPLLDAQARLLAAAKAGSVPSTLLAEVETAATTADVDYLSAEIPKALGQSLDGIERVTNIVRAMKEFSHPGTTEKTAIDLNRAIESTLTVCCSEWKYVADLKTDFDPSLPPVPVLPGEFNQVVLNIIINATHAIADVVGGGGNGKGTLSVSTRRDGEWVEVRLADSGTGIPEHARQRVFDPFFTTKGVGKGTGQGLAIAHSVVVEKHGGTIHFETETGKGTTFVIRLPLQSACLEKKAA